MYLVRSARQFLSAAWAVCTTLGVLTGCDSSGSTVNSSSAASQSCEVDPRPGKYNTRWVRFENESAGFDDLDARFPRDATCRTKYGEDKPAMYKMQRCVYTEDGLSTEFRDSAKFDKQHLAEYRKCCPKDIGNSVDDDEKCPHIGYLEDEGDGTTEDDEPSAELDASQISGTVTFDGRPIPGIRVSAWGPNSAPKEAGTLYTTSDSNGRFTFSISRQGEYNLIGNAGIFDPAKHCKRDEHSSKQYIFCGFIDNTQPGNTAYVLKLDVKSQLPSDQ